MSITVAGLLARPELGLTLLSPGAPGALERSIVWAHQSELDDPMAFSEPDEVLLTTGSLIPGPGSVPGSDATGQEAAGWERYVARLRESRAAALGFGVGVVHQEVPTALLDAAREQGLVVFEVPEALPFSSVIKAVSRAQADEETMRLRRMHVAQRRLIAAAAAPDVSRLLMVRAAEIIGGWAALVQPSGAVSEISHLAARPLAVETAREHAGSGRQVTFSSAEETELCACDVRTPDGDLLGILVTGSRRVGDPVVAAVPVMTSSLLGVSLARTRTGDRTVRSLRGALVTELLDGNLSLGRAVARALWNGLPREPFTVLCATASDEAYDLVAELAPFGPRPRATVAFGEQDDVLWVLVGSDRAPLVADRLRGIGAAVGSSPSTRWPDVASARREASGAMMLERAATHGPRPGGLADRTASSGLKAALAPEPARAFARVALGPLVGEGPEPRSLLATLETWLEADGGIAQTADSLGVHRHTVTRRLKRIEELLGVSLAQPRTQHELWLACTLWATHGPADRAGR
ncbi:PucR family transcriptional regulator [Demequina salsinemoris]|uniref:PucR family transcriptional regulator n=1 Tax=Demequina salsinemoris TaxID=577470 RepID=UPI000783DDC5|nr:PucR family transcriptional regulator [Demequina salsinemoris]